MASSTFNPSEFVSGSYSSISGQSNPVGKSETNTTYATINCTNGRSKASYAFWSFDCSSIPENATITSVSCKAKCYVSNTTRISTRGVQLYNGTTTAKGSSVTFSNSTSQTQTLSCGTWTRDELNNCYIRVSGTRGTSQTTSSAQLRFYGATLTVNYTVPVVKHTVSIVKYGYCSTSPSGVLSVDDGTNQTVTITLDSAGNNFWVTDNSIDVTSSVIMSGSKTYTYTFKVTEDHSIGVYAQNGTFYYKNNGSWKKCKLAYEKKNGAWVETYDLQSLFTDGKLYKLSKQ